MAKLKLNPEALLQQVLDSDFDLTVFNQIDEKQFKSAPNLLEFITGKEFCNATLLPWQVEAGMHLFSEYCPKCSNPDYIEDLFDEPLEEIKDNVSMLEYGVCPRCKQNRNELFTVGEFHPSMPSLKSEFTGCIGQRAGKSKAIACFSAYQTHRWCRIPDPIAYYDLPKMDVIIGTFSALSDEQAEENLWMPFKGLYDNAPWFQKYNEFLRQEQKRLSIPLIDSKDTYIFYVAKRLLLSYTGADDRKKRGRTRLFGAIDEIAFFNSENGGKGAKGKVMDADKNYTALNNSLSTIRKKAMNRIKKYGDYDVLFPVMYNASSPLNVRDKIMRLVKEAPNNPWAVAVHRATWEANPDYTEEDCWNINRGISQVEFWRDFGAVPPFSDAPYIGDVKSLTKLCTNEGILIDAKEEIFTDQMGDRYLTLRPRIPRPDKSTPRLLSLDNGFNNNAFAATIFRWDMFKKKPVLEFAVSLMPRGEEKLFINFPAMYENFILPLVKAFKFQHIFYDRWQSLDQIQRLRNLRIDAQAYSLRYDTDFLPFKQQLLDGNMIMPICKTDIEAVKEASDPLKMVREDPIATLIWQMLTVREVGKKILKPMDGDDDIFRAFALGASRFRDEKIQKKYETFGKVGTQVDKPVGRAYSMGQTATVANSGQGSSSRVGVGRTFGRRR